MQFAKWLGHRHRNTDMLEREIYRQIYTYSIYVYPIKT